MKQEEDPVNQRLRHQVEDMFPAVAAVAQRPLRHPVHDGSEFIFLPKCLSLPRHPLLRSAILEESRTRG